MVLTRSENMARIRATNTSPELILRRLLWAAGVRYRLHLRTPGGRADIAIPKAKLAIYIDGCFWHGCPDHYVRPRSRSEFWDRKLAENISRDRRQTATAEAAGWRVVRVWEHELRESPDAVCKDVVRAIQRGSVERRRDLRVTRVEFADPAGARERRRLEDLRDPTFNFVEEANRSTAKVGRVQRRRVRQR